MESVIGRWDSIWLYEPSMKTDPLFVVGLHLYRPVVNWLERHELSDALRNGYSDLIFENFDDVILFRFAFASTIRLWD
jgi:hypothetical protein